MKIKEYLQLNIYNRVFFLLLKHIFGKFIKRGNKLYAWTLYFKLKYLIKKKVKKDSNVILLIALLNSLIKVHFIRKRFGSVRKEIPIELKFERSIRFAIKNWIKFSFVSNKFNIKRLVLLICATFKSKGWIMRYKKILYQKAITNRILLNFIKR